MVMHIKILLADDHKIVRDGLRALIEKQADMSVVAEAENGWDAIKFAQQTHPSVVIMDVSMPDLNGIEATRKLIDNHSAIRVIALSMHSDRRLIMEMLRAGAHAFVLKECAFEELAGAIKAVVQGQHYLSPRIAGSVIEDFVRQMKEKPATPVVLTERERQVVQMLAEGLTNKDIAHRMGISPKTIDSHRFQIMTKLNLHSVAELTKYAVREGITSLDK